jgi:hypothetical protein
MTVEYLLRTDATETFDAALDGTLINGASVTGRQHLTTGNISISNTQSINGTRSALTNGSTGGVRVSPLASNDFLYDDVFTLELHIYPTTSHGNNSLFIWGTYFGINIDHNTSSNQQLYLNSGSPSFFDHSWNLNQWNHIALVRDSMVGPNNVKIYADGVMVHQTTNTGTVGYSDSAPNIGPGTPNTYFDRIRFSKGIARYTGAFTPPTDIPTEDVYDVMILNMEDTLSGSDITDSTGTKSLATIRSSSQYMQFPNSLKWPYLTNDWTVTGWVKMNDITSITNLFAYATTGSVQFAFDNGLLKAYVETSQVFTGGTTAPVDIWILVTFTRSGNLWKTYIDKTLNQQVTDSRSIGGAAHANGTMIAAEVTAPSQFSDGRHGTLRIYNRALPLAEIEDIYDIETVLYNGPSSSS